MLVVRGSFQPEIEEAFAERIRELMSPAAAPVLVVSPSRRMVDRLERLAAVEKRIPLFNVHFHTFYSLAWALAEEAGLPEGEFVSDPVFHGRALESVIRELSPRLGAFGKARQPRILAASLGPVLRDLADAGASRAHLKEHFGEVLDGETLDHLEALLDVSDAYRGKLADLKIYSPTDVLRSACERAEASTFLKSFGEILYYGFYDLTGLQSEFFERVAAAHPCRLFFPYCKAHPAFDFARGFFDQKLGAWENRPAESSPPRAALGAALDRLFNADAAAPTAPKEGALRFVSVSEAEDEIWFAAKEILRLSEEEGVAFEDIGVVARSMEGYRDAVSRVFSENAIPFRGPGRESVIRHPLAATALELLGIRLDDFPLGRVCDIAASPYFSSALGSRETWRAALWKTARTLQINGGWVQWRGKLRGRLDSNEKPSADFPLREAARLWETLESWNRALAEAPASWTSFGRRAWTLLENFLSLPADASPREIEVLGALKETLDALGRLDKIGPPKDWADALEAFENALKPAALKSPGEIRGARVLDAMEARGESFRVLFLVGLNVGVFPRSISEDALLKDQTRAFLRHPAGYWIRPKKEGHEEEKLLFYLACASASERLYCVYSRSDEEGRPRSPSLFLHELARASGRALTPDVRVPRGPAAKLGVFPRTYLLPSEISLGSAREAADYLDAAGGSLGILLRAGLEASARLNQGGDPGPQDGLIASPRRFLKRWEAKGISSHSVKDYAECPFRFFAARVLELEDEGGAGEKGGMDPRTAGHVYHEVLRRFYSLIPKKFWDRKDAAWEVFLDKAVEEAFEEFSPDRLGLYPLLWLSFKEEAVQKLRRFIAWDLERMKESGFKPRAFEIELSADIPELGGRKIRGVLDRVDENADRKKSRVIDYKTRWGVDFRFQGRSGLAKLVSKGAYFQIPFYMELAGQAERGAALEGASLYSIEESEFPSDHPYSIEEWRAQRRDFFKNVSDLLDRVADGRFPIRPDEGEFGHCRYCDFKSACRKSHAPSRRRATRVIQAVVDAEDDPTEET